MRLHEDPSISQDAVPLTDKSAGILRIHKTIHMDPPVINTGTITISTVNVMSETPIP